jgi:hypothetical protein
MIRKTRNAFKRGFVGKIWALLFFTLLLTVSYSNLSMAQDEQLTGLLPHSDSPSPGSGVSIDRATGKKTLSYLRQNGDKWLQTNSENSAKSNAITTAFEPKSMTTSAVNSGIFAPYKAFPVGSWPEAVAIGDVNGDGLNDVVMTTSSYSDPDNDYHIFVFLQNASHQLSPPIKYPAGNGYSVDIGDLNNDGKADVAVTAYGGIGVFYQNATGGLDPMVFYPSINNTALDTYKLKIGDFNHDGLLDVAVIYWGSTSFGPHAQDVEIYYQNASGKLDPPVSYTVLHDGWDDLKVGDVNNDGLLDIIVMNGQGFGANLGILLQQPDGTFGQPVYYDLGGNELTTGVAVGDISGNKLQDVVVSFGGNQPDSKIGTFLQNASGTLDPAINYSSYDCPEAIEIMDVNGDGKNDVIVAHGGWEALGVYRQDGNGNLMAEELYPLPYASHYNPHGLAVVDINGHGSNDVVIADYNNGLVVLYNKIIPTIKVLPSVNKAWPLESTQKILWNSTGIEGNVKIELSRDGGKNWESLADSSPNNGEMDWKVQGATTKSARIRISSFLYPSIQATSTSNFSITGRITLLSPNGGDIWTAGNTHKIQWDSESVTGNIKIELSQNGGKTWTTAVASTPNTGEATWTVKSSATVAARIRVRSLITPSVVDASDANFTIIGQINVTTPNGGESWPVGSTQTIKWKPISVKGNAKIELSRDGGTTWETIADSTPNSGSMKWKVQGPATLTARIRVTSVLDPTITDTGDADFRITSITVTTPQPADTWTVGSDQSIQWDSLGVPENVTIMLSRNGGSSWKPLFTDIPNSGAQQWVVTGPAAKKALIKVISVNDKLLFGVNSPGFIIQ